MSNTHTTEIVLDGFEATIKVAYDYEPGDPGHYSGPPEDCYPAIEEKFNFTRLWIDVVGGYKRCDLLLQFIDDQAIIEEIKESWRE